MGSRRSQFRQGIRDEWNGVASRRRHVFDFCWLDESLGAGAGVALESFQRRTKLTIGELRLIADEHPGMMDADICNRLLRGRRSCLLTSDRAFHNALCAEGVTSFYLDPDTLRISAANPF